MTGESREEQERLNIIDCVINEGDSFSSIINYSLLTTKATKREIRTPGFLCQNIVRHDLPEKFQDNKAYSIILQFSRDKLIEKNFDDDISAAKKHSRRYGKTFPLPPTSNATIHHWESYFKNDWHHLIVEIMMVVLSASFHLTIFACIVLLFFLQKEEKKIRVWYSYSCISHYLCFLVACYELLRGRCVVLLLAYPKGTLADFQGKHAG